MKFLFVVNILKNKNTGAGGHIMRLAKVLNKNSHTTHTLFRDGLGLKINKNIFLHGIVFLLFPVLAPLKIFRLDFINHYDFVIFSSGDGFLYALCMKIFLRKKKPIIVMRSHGYEYLKKKEFEIEKQFQKYPLFSFKEKVFLFGFRLIQVKIFSYFCDGIFCLNRNEKAYLENIYPKKKICAIPIGIDPIFISQKETVRDRDILFVGGWCRMKGYIYLADIITRLNKDINGLTVSIMGTGVNEKNVLNNFPEMIRNRIRTVKFIPRDMLKREYLRHKVFLFPSLFEGYGNVILEAMASGAAVITSKSLGASELIKDGYNGFLIEKRDVEDFAKTAKHVLGDEALMKKIGENATSSVSHMTWNNIGERFAKTCEEILIGI